MAATLLNTKAALDGKTVMVLETAETITALKTFDRDPNAPFAVTASSAVVTNLDADKLDGYEASALAVLAENETVTGNWTLSGALTLSGANAVSGVQTFSGLNIFTADQTFNDSVKVTLGTGGDADIYYDGTNLVVEPRVVGSGHLVINDACMILLNETTNANMTVGLTINQGAAINDIVAFKGSAVAHGITTLAETDTFGQFRLPTSAGGLVVRGLGGVNTVASLYITGVNTTAADTTHTAAGIGVVQVDTGVKSGTDIGAVATNGNLFVVTNNSSAAFIVDADGDTFQDGTAGTGYSDYDDPMLALAVEHHINPRQHVAKVFQTYCQYNKSTLVEAGILAPDGPDGERGFVNMSALARLAIGGLWQLGVKTRELESRQARLETENRELRAMARLAQSGER